MKTLISYIILLLFISCSQSSNSEAFIEKAQGRYLYNSDEIVEVYFKNNELFLKWRGATAIKPLKVAENTFFVKEMNEKIQFLDNPINSKTYMALVPKESIDSLTYDYRKLADNEKIPSEYFAEKEFDKALEAYITIQKKDSLDPAIDEGNFNRIGYNKLRDKNFEEALEVFKINMKLHPESSNVYDSYADALKRSGDTITAIEYYKKSLAIDSGNRSAKEFVEKYDVKE
jgi:tetratricopeptide (TPR) repeat protein